MDIIFDPQMTPGDMSALDLFVKDRRPYMAVEVGSWKGLSTSLMAPHAGSIYCIDTWRAAASTPQMEAEAQQRDVFMIFRHNMMQLNFMNKVHPMMMSSIQAARILKDQSADLVFIDADHAYTSVAQDIRAWSTKVKPGGVLCGHDSDILWKNCDAAMREVIEKNKETDFIRDFAGPGRGVHPGVVCAIRDIFDDNVNILPGSSIWWVQK